MKVLSIIYIGVGLFMALIMKALIPAMSLVGITWYMVSLPYQILAAMLVTLPIAPDFMIPWLFNV